MSRKVEWRCSGEAALGIGRGRVPGSCAGTARMQPAAACSATAEIRVVLGIVDEPSGMVLHKLYSAVITCNAAHDILTEVAWA